MFNLVSYFHIFFYLPLVICIMYLYQAKKLYTRKNQILLSILSFLIFLNLIYDAHWLLPSPNFTTLNDNLLTVFLKLPIMNKCLFIFFSILSFLIYYCLLHKNS
jgi:hypothetical protein